MSTIAPERDITAVPRAVITFSARIFGQLQRALVDEKGIATAQSNAWDAVCADRARAAERADLRARLRRP
ncbi:hypothetical protein AB0H43_29465 [Hamadaea sp. NPDC050747]|uniref:hypothetical protein n=1 Tax=Hamadaea sp. NPDC050747 TaxID=3155789 RepID=UPI003409DB8D